MRRTGNVIYVNMKRKVPCCGQGYTDIDLDLGSGIGFVDLNIYSDTIILFIFKSLLSSKKTIHIVGFLIFNFQGIKSSFGC